MLFLQLLQFFQTFLGVVADVGFLVLVRDLPVLVDDERPAVDEYAEIGVQLSVGAFYLD
jgi:hypothetical protein